MGALFGAPPRGRVPQPHRASRGTGMSGVDGFAYALHSSPKTGTQVAVSNQLSLRNRFLIEHHVDPAHRFSVKRLCACSVALTTTLLASHSPGHQSVRTGHRPLRPPRAAHGADSCLHHVGHQVHGCRLDSHVADELHEYPIASKFENNESLSLFVRAIWHRELDRLSNLQFGVCA